MGLLDQLGGMLKQYQAGNTPANPEDASAHLGDAAQQAPPSALAGALTQVFRSSETGTFGQNIAQMFGQSTPEQQAGIINQLLRSAGPAVLGSLGGLLGGTTLAGATGSSAAPQVVPGVTPGIAPEITPEIAQQIPPQAVEELANHAQAHNPSIVEEAGQFYSQHPTLVKALGAGAAMIALRHLASNQ